MKVIIPMAGRGSRFAVAAEANPAYRVPKPFIKVREKPMVRWATGSLPFIAHPDRPDRSDARVQPKDLIFIILREHNITYAIAQGLREIYSDEITIIELAEVSRGTAETVMNAEPYIDPDEDILITDSDHYFDGSMLENMVVNKHPDTAGIIPVFRARNEGIPKWSYSLLRDGTNLIERVAEKDIELMNAGAHANIGGYYFSKALYFLNAARNALEHNRPSGVVGQAEFFIAPLYQDLINAGHRIEAAIIPQVWGLGTPSDLEYFLSHNKHNAPEW